MEPVVEIILHIEKKDSQIKAFFVVKNSGQSSVFIDKRYIPQYNHLTSDWISNECDSKKIEFDGERYNIGVLGSYYEIKSNENKVSAQIDLTKYFRFPDGFYQCSAHLDAWVATDPRIKSDYDGEVNITSFKSNVVTFNINGMEYKSYYMHQHKGGEK